MAQLFGILLLCSFIGAGLTCDDYYSVKRNCSSCGLNAACVPAGNLIWCVCKEKYLGDGLHCTVTSTCTDNTCCPNTYTLDQAQHCCSSTNLCADPSLNHCDPNETCQPNSDHYLCVGPDRGNSSLAGCNGESCTGGQDCKRYTDGQVRCIDPCQEHQYLDNSWRADNQSSGQDLHEDSHLHGWFTFSGPGGRRMPEACISSFHCGTGTPVSLGGPHPTLEEGIVLRHGLYGTNCEVTSQIYVKACPGNIFVYKFMGLYYPGFGYCTDHTTAPACVPACAQDEECLWVNNGWGCSCKADATLAPGDSQLDQAVSCSGSRLTLTVSRCRLERLGYESSTTHLTDPACEWQRGYGGPFSTITVSSDFEQCGTIITVIDGNRASFSNIIYLTSQNSLTAVNQQVPVSCECTLDMQLSVKLYGDAAQSFLAVTIPGLGSFILRLSMFKDADFTKPYSQNNLVLPRSLSAYVGGWIQDGTTNGAVIAMRNCFATPSSSPQDTNKHFFIQNRCANVADSSVELIQLAERSQTGFKTLLFEESWGSDTVYLHCAFDICSSADVAPCASVCPASTDAASADFTNLLTLGPIRRAGVTGVTPTVTCDLTGIIVSVEQTVVKDLGFTTTTLTKTQETHCTGIAHNGALGLISIHTPFLKKECGLHFTVNDSTVSISSTLYLAEQTNGEISSLSAGIPFTCIFQLKKFGVSGIEIESQADMYTAKISVFSDPDYTVLDTSLGATDFVPGNRLYVQVALTGTNNTTSALVLHSCDATVTSLQGMTKIELIANGAAVSGPLNTVVTENGDSSKARFSFEVSEAMHAAEEISFQCQVSQCVMGNGSCLQQRKRRSALQEDRVDTWVVSHRHFRRLRS